MRRSAFVRRTVLMTLSMAVGILPLSGSAAGVPDRGGRAEYREATEELFCYTCGETKTFWICYEPELAAGERSLAEDGVRYAGDTVPAAGEDGSDPTYTDCHWKWTMCLTCGTINGDLPPDDEAFWQNLFRLEEHSFAVQIIPPSCTEGGCIEYTCVCGYGYREETAAAGHSFGEWETDREPTAEAEGSRRRTCRVCGETEREALPRLTPTPDPAPAPAPSPAPPPVPAPDTSPEEDRDDAPSPARPRWDAYVNGLPGGLFAPDRAMTRAEAAVMLARLLGETQETDDSRFADVPAGAWYAGAVERLAGRGVLRGRGDGRFAPGEPVTRAEFAAMVLRAFGGGAEGPACADAFDDVPDSHWAADAIRRGAALGWFRGDGSGQFHPDDPVTRAEGVTALNRITGRQADLAYIDAHPDDLRTFADAGPGCWAWRDILAAANGQAVL